MAAVFSKYKLLLYFIVAIIGSAYFNHFPLFYFAPPLLLALYSYPLSRSLWIALASGLWIDLLSGGSPLGFYPTLYILSLMAIYPLKKYFFLEKWTTLPLLTFLFSLLVTSLHTCFTTPYPISLDWLVTDFLLMPLADAVYAFTISLPGFLFKSNTREHFQARSYSKSRGHS